MLRYKQRRVVVLSVEGLDQRRRERQRCVAVKGVSVGDLVSQDTIAHWLLDSIPQDGLPVFHTGLEYLARNSTHSSADIRHDVTG